MQKLRRKRRHDAGLAQVRQKKDGPTPTQSWEVKIGGQWVPLGKHGHRPRVGGYVYIGGRLVHVKKVRSA